MYSGKFKEIKLPHTPQQQANLVSQDAGTVPPRHTGHCFLLRVFWPRRMLQDSQPALPPSSAGHSRTLGTSQPRGRKQQQKGKKKKKPPLSSGRAGPPPAGGRSQLRVPPLLPPGSVLSPDTERRARGRLQLPVPAPARLPPAQLSHSSGHDPPAGPCPGDRAPPGTPPGTPPALSPAGTSCPGGAAPRPPRWPCRNPPPPVPVPSWAPW